MPATAKTVAEVNSIIGGRGAMDLSEGLVALMGATGLAMFAKKIGLWPKYSAIEQTEVEMLDAEMPKGFWRRVKDTAPAAAMSGHKIRWNHGNWSVGTDEHGDLMVTTPMLDEDSDTLV